MLWNGFIFKSVKVITFVKLENLT